MSSDRITLTKNRMGRILMVPKKKKQKIIKMMAKTKRSMKSTSEAINGASSLLFTVLFEFFCH